MKNLDQERAAHAAACINAIKNDSHADDYAREAKKLPVRIMNSGLGQALVFIAIKAQKKEILNQLEVDLKNWIMNERGIYGQLPNGKLLYNVIDTRTTSDDLRRATNEILTYLQWLNRFAEAYGLKGEDNE